MSDRRYIGGFLELDVPETRGGVMSFWQRGAHATFDFENARSALHNLAVALSPETIWLPAFICTEMAAALPSDKLRYYAVGDRLRPDVASLDESARSGDLVLGVDFFGREPEPDFLAFARRRRDLIFVEDCAQAFDTGTSPWGDWRLYSPRKLVGVPDGGLLFAMRPPAVILSRTASRFDAGTYEAALRRFEDLDEVDNEAWYTAHRRREAAAVVSDRGMSRLGRRLLNLMDAGRIGDLRRTNYRRLAGRLADVALIPDTDPTFVPFGFPIRIEPSERDRVMRALWAKGIFAACHWRHLPSPSETFAAEHRLASEIVTLPCDHRYGPTETDRVASEVEFALR